MRPDCVLMKRLNVSIPRLSPAESFVNHHPKNFNNTPPDSSEMEEEDDLVVIETTCDSMKTNEISVLSSENNKDIDYCDQESVCSETSVLSVGQETICKTNSKNLNHIPSQNLIRNENFFHPSSEESNELTALKINQHLHRATNSAFSFADLQNAPVTVPPMAAVPGNASFQNFFLKNSLYAEELMKHQMKLMAGVISMKTTPTFIERPNLTNLQSHLNTISQLSAAAAAAAALSAASNNVPYNPQATMQNNILMDLSRVGFPDRRASEEATALEDHLNHHNNETALKFSIDNILKADFGRKSDEEGPQSSNHSIGKHKKRLTEPSKNSTNAFKASLESRKILPLGFSNSLENIISSQRKDTSFFKDDHGNAKSNRDMLSPSFSESSVEKLDKNGLSGKNQEGNSSIESGSASGSSGSGGSSSSNGNTSGTGSDPIVWPAWVYCTRYSDRPSSGPRTRKPKKPVQPNEKGNNSNGGGNGTGASAALTEDKRPRTAFSSSQLARLKHEFNENRYLTEKRRQQLSSELGLNEAQIKIWFQNKRAKLKKSSGTKNPLALQLMAQGLYNHSTIPLTKEEEELQEMQEREYADDDSP